MPPRRDPSLDRFLLPGERVVVDVRQHWGVIIGPVASVVAALVVVLWVDANVRLDGGPIARGLWWIWFVALGWLVFQILQWRHDRFIATDKRLLLNYGLFTTKVAMMPLSKVTDMSFQRSVPGRVFGWGRFILESAGQDQALRQIDWVPDPDYTYRVICAEIFGVTDDEDGDNGDNRNNGDDGDDGGPRRWGFGGPDRPDGFGGSGGPGGPDGPDDDGPGPADDTLGGWSGLGGFGRRGGRRRDRTRTPVVSPLGPLGPVSEPAESPVHSPIRERGASHSRAIPIHRPSSQPSTRPAVSSPGGETLYSSDDERRRRRTADTGPIPITDPADEDR